MTQQRRLSYLLVLNILMIVGLIVVGLTARSLGVLAAGGDFIADSLAIALGIMAVHLRNHHDKKQAPTYVALVNGSILIVITAYVFIEATMRLLTHNPEVQGLPVLIVSAISTVVMAMGAIILGKGAGNEDLHMRSVLLDTISDGLAAASVAVAGGVIYFAHGLYWLDSVAAILVGIIIGYEALRLLGDVFQSLRKGTPFKVKG